MTLLLAGALLAGCSTDPAPTDNGTDEPAPMQPGNSWFHRAGGRSAEASEFAGAAPRFDQLHVTSRVSGEPTIGITRTGAVFYPAIDFDSGLPGAQKLPRTIYYRSVDGGAVWEDFSPHLLQVDTHASSFDPYVYVDPTTGRVFAMDMGPHVACNKVSWSDDDGRTWLTRDGACPIPVADHPTIFAAPANAATVGPYVPGVPTFPLVPSAPKGYPNAVILCANQIADVQCSMSPDGGFNWLPSQPVFVGVEPGNSGLDAVCGSLTGHGHGSFADGTLYLGKAHCHVIMTGLSHDGGLTWTQATIADGAQYAPRGEHDVSIGTDLNGTAYAFWIGNGTTAWLSSSADKGLTWSTPLDVTAPGVTAAKLPSLVAGAQGRIAIQYVGTTTPSGWGITEEDNASERRNATWNVYVTVSLDAHTEDPVFATTTVNDLDKPVKRGNCDGRCFGDVGGMYDFLDIDIDPMTGRIWSAIVDVCTGDCDVAGADAETLQRAMGAVGKQVGGTFLLEEPYPQR